jgi:cysteine-rich repeat protein
MRWYAGWRSAAWLIAASATTFACGGTTDECPGGCPEGQTCFVGSCVPVIDAGDETEVDGADGPDADDGDEGETGDGFCGNGFVEPGEECDDGNPTPGDGCEPDCTWTCSVAGDCDDHNACSGEETCRSHVCVPGTPPADGSSCTSSTNVEGVCRGGLCAPATCGNGVVEPGEECDDGNPDNTDACLTNCRNATCGDGFVRTGAEQCDGDPPWSCLTTCGSTGGRACTACTWEATCTPPAETCNGLDDDCDTATDNGFPCSRGEPVACSTTCGSLGTGRCTALCLLPASADCALPGESCNGVDDDCDGATDEGFSCAVGSTVACISSCGSTGSGVCTATCEVPTGTACLPPAETCNGWDDDCDGACDDGFACCAGAATPCATTCGSTGLGVCSSGCELPSPAACVPPPETCNGTDDDCDTLTDDGFACIGGSTRACTVCAGAGTQPCMADCSGWGVCTRPEACNGCDDDGDTAIDEGFACSPGATGSCTLTVSCTGLRSCASDCTWEACALPPPRPLWPWNGGYTGSLHAATGRQTLRPEFRWSEIVGCGPVTYDIQVDDSCTTPGFATCSFGSPEASATAVAGGSFHPSADLPVSSTAPVGRRYYWRVRTCSGTSCSIWSAVRYADVGRVPNDFNGDGYSDVVVGAVHEYRTVRWQATGAAYVYYGGPAGIPTSPSVNLADPDLEIGAQFGYSLAAGGDVNADGFGDLVVGAVGKSYSPTAAGIAFVYLGGVGGIGTEPTAEFGPPAGVSMDFPDAMSVAGDLDADGFADLAAAGYGSVAPFEGGGLFVFRGGETGLADLVAADAVCPGRDVTTEFGQTVATAGDVDGDGRADIIVGAPGWTSAAARAGSVLLFLGQRGGIAESPSASFRGTPEEANASFGDGLAARGDLDGDGYADIVVGAKRQDGLNLDEGKVFAFYGRVLPIPGAPGATLDDPDGAASDWFGSSLSISDFDGDDYDDLVVGAPRGSGSAPGPGQAFLYLGSAAGVLAAPLTRLSHPTLESGAQFGRSSCAAGDVNGDGYWDLVVGAPYGAAGAGQAFVYLGGPEGLSGTPDITLVHPTGLIWSSFGLSLAKLWSLPDGKGRWTDSLEDRWFLA